MRHNFYLFMLLLTLHISSSYTTPATFINPDQLTISPFSIDAPGLYVLTDDVDYQTVGGTTITINSSNVTLDLNGKAIINANMAGIQNAIALGSTYTNITIKNGALRVFDGTGISIPAGSRDLAFEDLTIVGVGTVGTGFTFSGSFGAITRTKNVRIKNCLVRNCAFGLRTTAVDAGLMENSSFNSNNFGIFCDDSNGWNATNSQSSSCIVGIELRSCTCWTMKNCDFSNNSSSSSNAGMFLLGTTLAVSGAHIFEDCTFCNNSSTAGGCQGVNASLTSSCIFRNCSADGTSGVSVTTGFLLSGSGYVMENCTASGNMSTGNLVRGFSSTGTAHYLINCTASGNLAGTTGVSNGIFLSGIGHIAVNCITSGNFSPTNIAAGIFNSGTSGCLIKNCTSVGNSGNSDGNSRGFVGSSAGADLWIGNIAFGQATNYFSTVIPYLTVAATGPYPLAGFFDNRDLTNISFD